MGVYDQLPQGSQVKCWEQTLRQYKVGNHVPRPQGLQTGSYIVLLREGGYVKVIGDFISDILEDKIPHEVEEFTLPVIDKWGGGIPNGEALTTRDALGNIISSYYFNP